MEKLVAPRTSPGRPDDVCSLQRNHPNYIPGAGVSRARGYHANTCPTLANSGDPYSHSRVLPGTVAEPADSLLRDLYILLRAIKPPWNNIMKITPQSYMNHLLPSSHAYTQCHNSSLDGRWGEPPDISANSEDKSLGAADSRSELNPPRRLLGGRWASSNPVADIASCDLGDLISLRPGPARPTSKIVPVLG